MRARRRCFATRRSGRRARRLRRAWRKARHPQVRHGLLQEESRRMQGSAQVIDHAARWGEARWGEARWGEASRRAVTASVQQQVVRPAGTARPTMRAARWSAPTGSHGRARSPSAPCHFRLAGGGEIMVSLCQFNWPRRNLQQLQRGNAMEKLICNSRRGGGENL